MSCCCTKSKRPLLKALYVSPCARHFCYRSLYTETNPTDVSVKFGVALFVCFVEI